MTKIIAAVAALTLLTKPVQLELELPAVSGPKNPQVEVALPLYQPEDFRGHFTNAKAAAQLLTPPEGVILQPGETFSVLKQLNYLDSDQFVYAAGSPSFANGACWTVSALKALIEETNKNYSQPIFLIEETHPHSRNFVTYNLGDTPGPGAAIYIAKVGNPQSLHYDFRFQINPELPQETRVRINLTAETSPVETISGRVTIYPENDILGKIVTRDEG
jgi:hypothetical protein